MKPTWVLREDETITAVRTVVATRIGFRRVGRLHILVAPQG